MVRVVFKNLEKSEFIQELVREKISHSLAKFPELENATTTITVGMENSQFRAGPDIFQVRLILLSRGLKPIVLEKEAASPYQAAALLSDRLFEVLHRAFDRRRERLRSEKRRWKGSPHLNHEWRSAG